MDIAKFAVLKFFLPKCADCLTKCTHCWGSGTKQEGGFYEKDISKKSYAFYWYLEINLNFIFYVIA